MIAVTAAVGGATAASMTTLYPVATTSWDKLSARQREVLAILRERSGSSGDGWVGAETWHASHLDPSIVRVLRKLERKGLVQSWQYEDNTYWRPTQQ